MIKIPFKRLHERAQKPTSIPDDVGFDLYAVEHVIIPEHSTAKIGTGIAIAGPVKLPVRLCDLEPLRPFLKIEGRSSWAAKGLFPVGGIIDPTYRGEIIVVMANVNGFPAEVRPGEKFAQLVMYTAIFGVGVNFSEVEEAEKTERGTGGFGSTGA